MSPVCTASNPATAYFYIWLPRSLKRVFPDLFAMLAVPKAEELVATPYRHGSKEVAETFLLQGMTQALRQLSAQAHPGFHTTIYYAFKQSEAKVDQGTASTGWEMFLDAVIRAGFAITGTWPMRTELDRRMVGMGTNALASSIILVCRCRPTDAPKATRREFFTSLRSELPKALRFLQSGNIGPGRPRQAAIGSGMAVYTVPRKRLGAPNVSARSRAGPTPTASPRSAGAGWPPARTSPGSRLGRVRVQHQQPGVAATL